MRLFICGDSTAASYTPAEAPMTGWGQVLGDYLPGVEIENHAMAGRSTKSFLAEGRLQKIETEIKPGDALLIQFAHNDEGDLTWRRTEAWSSYMNNLSIFIDTARQTGALPVLITPICMRLWKDGALQPTHGEYLAAMRTLAGQRGVPLVDAYEGTFAHVAALGDEASRGLYMRLEKGKYPGYPDGREDDVHTQEAGARAYAKIIAEKLKPILDQFNGNGGNGTCIS